MESRSDRRRHRSHRERPSIAPFWCIHPAGGHRGSSRREFLGGLHGLAPDHAALRPADADSALSNARLLRERLFVGAAAKAQYLPLTDYAERFAERFRGVRGHPYEPGVDLILRAERLAQPLGWRRPRLIFANSMSDLFHKDVPTNFIDQGRRPLFTNNRLIRSKAETRYPATVLPVLTPGLVSVKMRGSLPSKVGR